VSEPYVGSNLGPLTRGGDSWDAFPEAPKVSGGWDAFPEAKPADWQATGKGLAAAAGSGLVKGYSALAGLPADAVVLGAKGAEAASNFINDKLGKPRFAPADETPPAWLPTSDRLQKTVEENVTGELHKAATTPEKYLETMASFGPAAIAGPGGIARKMLMQAAVPGAASEAAGQYFEGKPAEPWARAGGALLGGLAGAAVSRPGSVNASLRSQMPEGITQNMVDDARSLMVTAKSKGIDLTWPEALSQSAGRPVLSDTQRILESAPQSRTRMQEFYAGRPQQFDQAALNELQHIAPGTANPSTIGPQVGKASNEYLHDVRKGINADAEPFYEAAKGVKFTPDEYTAFAGARSNPAGTVKDIIDAAGEPVRASHAIGIAKKLYSDQEFRLIEKVPGYTKTLEAVRNGPNAWRIAHLPDNSVGVLDAVKKEFDQMAKSAGSKFNPQQNQTTRATHEMAASALKQIGETKSKDYARALQIEREGRRDILEPLLQGPLGRLAKKDTTTQKAIDVLFPSNPLPNSHHEISEAVGALSKKNPGAATQLVRAHIESTFNEATRALQGGANQFGAAGFAKKLVGNIQQRANLEAAITALPNGKTLWQGFDNFLEAAEATGTRQGKGSLTAFNAQELKSMSGSNMVGEAVKTGLSPGKWWSVVNDKWGQWKLGRNLDQLAQILTDPRSAPVMKRIAAMPKGSSEAGYLVSRLILQADTTANLRKPAK